MAETTPSGRNETAIGPRSPMSLIEGGMMETEPTTIPGSAFSSTGLKPALRLARWRRGHGKISNLDSVDESALVKGMTHPQVGFMLSFKCWLWFFSLFLIMTFEHWLLWMVRHDGRYKPT